MNEIDFLPLEYHQKSAERRQRPWRTVVVLAFAALLGAATMVDLQRRQRLRNDLETIRPQYEKAVAQTARLADLQLQMRSARAEADLYTYLRHPWPRTQILAALLAPLPEEIVIEELTVQEERPASHEATRSSSKPAAKRLDPRAEEAELAKLPPPARDLKRIRAEYDTKQTIVILTGQSPESAALHHYLGELGKNDLFRKVQLRSLDTLKSERGPTLRFVAVVQVRPGYGQPGGPAVGKAALAQSGQPSLEAKSPTP